MSTTLVMIDDNLVTWKILACQYGSEDLVPQNDDDCPYYQEYREQNSCVSRSGGRICGGFMGSEPGYVYCLWGLTLEDKRQAEGLLEEP